MKYFLIFILFLFISCDKSNIVKEQRIFENIESCCKGTDIECEWYRSKALTFKNLKGVIKVIPVFADTYSYEFYSDTLKFLPVTELQLPNYKYDTQGNSISACNLPKEILLLKKDTNVIFDCRFVWTQKKPANCDCASLLVELSRIEIID